MKELLNLKGLKGISLIELDTKIQNLFGADNSFFDYDMSDTITKSYNNNKKCAFSYIKDIYNDNGYLCKIIDCKVIFEVEKLDIENIEQTLVNVIDISKISF